MAEIRDSWTINCDDAARVRALAEERPLGGRRKWSTGLAPTGWFFVLSIAAVAMGALLAIAT